jgi:hypothetical protein
MTAGEQGSRWPYTLVYRLKGSIDHRTDKAKNAPGGDSRPENGKFARQKSPKSRAKPAARRDFPRSRQPGSL